MESRSPNLSDITDLLAIENPAPFARIDRLVTKEGFAFQAWADRYGKGVWAALGVSENDVDVVRDLSSDGDLDMIPAMDYVFSADWLPYVTGCTLQDAMAKLEVRLATLPQDQIGSQTEWSRLVYDAIDTLRTTRPDRLTNLPQTFEAALAAQPER